jgi:alkylation response protein AidB-like acyl-CoA dehydrogenase
MDKTIKRMRVYGYQGAYALDRYYKGYIAAEVGATGDASEKMAANNFPSPVLTGLAHYYISQAKLYNTEISNYILYDAQQIHGGSGFISETEVNKIARDVRVLPIYEGTSEIHEWIISRAQDAINMLPKFKRVSSDWEGDLTVYEKILYERFPGIAGKI